MNSIDMACMPKNPESVERWCAHLPGDTAVAAVNQTEAQKICDAVNTALYSSKPRAHACERPWGYASLEEVHDFESWAMSGSPEALAVLAASRSDRMKREGISYTLEHPSTVDRPVDTDEVSRWVAKVDPYGSTGRS